VFDLIVVGHSLPTPERKKLMEEVRIRCTSPVLALHRHGDLPVPGADYVFDASDNPARLLEVVRNIFASRKGRA
jgi:hypothetical protein